MIRVCSNGEKRKMIEKLTVHNETEDGRLLSLPKSIYSSDGLELKGG